MAFPPPKKVQYIGSFLPWCQVNYSVVSPLYPDESLKMTGLHSLWNLQPACIMLFVENLSKPLLISCLSLDRPLFYFFIDKR